MDSPTPISGMSPSSALESSSSESIPRPSERSLDSESIRNRLILLDEDSGEILGTIGDQYDIKQHPNVDATSGEKEPVVVDLPTSDDEDGEVFVQSIPADEKDILLKSAKKISGGITSVTNVLASSMADLATYYKSHSTPSAKLHVISEHTKAELRDMRDASGQVAEFTKKAVEFVDDRIFNAMEYVDRHVGSKKRHEGGNDAICSRDSSPILGTTSSSSTPGSASRAGSSSPLPAPAALVPMHFYDSAQAKTPPLLPSRNSHNLHSSDLPIFSSSSNSKLSSPLPSAFQSTPAPQQALQKRTLIARLFISGDLILNTLENSAVTLVDASTSSLSDAISYKLGADLGEASNLVGQSARNAVVVYIDADGVGRNALLRKAGQSFVRARIGAEGVSVTEESNGSSLTVPDTQS